MSRRQPLPAPPANIEAEMSVLGACLIEAAAIDTTAAILQAQDFTREDHRTLFDAIKAMHSRMEAIDFITVKAELTSRNLPISDSYVATLLDTVPTAANAAFYCGLVKEASIKRQAWEAFQRLAEIAQRGEVDPCDLVSQAQRALDRITAQAGDKITAAVRRPAPLAERLEDIYDLWASEQEPIPHVLENVIVEGCQTVLVAPGGTGKSVSAYNIACHLGEGRELWGLSVPKPRRVIYVDLENPRFKRQGQIKRMYRDVPPVQSHVQVLPQFDIGRDFRDLKRLCLERGIEVVIFDTASRCFPRENENDASQAYAAVAEPLDELKRAGIATLTLGHTGKNGDDQRGSGAVRDAVDIMLTMKLHRGDLKKRDAVLRLSYLKGRVIDVEQDIYLQQDGGQFRRLTEQEAGKPAGGDDEAPTAKIACAQVITEFLESRPQSHASYGEIISAAKERGFAESTAKRARAQLEEEGAILRAANGGYVLSDPFAD